MHDTALRFGRLFFDTYFAHATGKRIVDIGSQDVNGTLRSGAPAGNEYIGLDFVEGRGVDVILTDPYSLPFEDNSVDVCVSSSVFEHSEFFWVLFTEILRILKPDGLLYINVPSNGAFHRYPVDCWRMYPDSGIALQNWARRNGVDALLLESFVGQQGLETWNDFVAVFLKDRANAANYKKRMQEQGIRYTNGRRGDSEQITHRSKWPQDQRRLTWRHVLRLGRAAFTKATAK
jgi:SAM-dependent methyltransferase